MWEKWQNCDAIVTVIQPWGHRRLLFLILSKKTPMEAHLLIGLLSQTQTVVVDSRGFSCDTKRHFWRDLNEVVWLQSQHFCLLAHLLLLDIQHSVVDGDKDVLRVHVVHQTTGREDLQDPLYEDRRRQSVFKVCQIYQMLHIKRKMICFLGQEPHRYSLPNTHGRQLSGNQYKSERKKKSMNQKTENEPTRESSMMRCFRQTWVKSLAPATSTNITLLQSIKTAWISDSTVSGRKERKDLFNIDLFFLNNQDKHPHGCNLVAYQI